VAIDEFCKWIILKIPELYPSRKPIDSNIICIYVLPAVNENKSIHVMKNMVMNNLTTQVRIEDFQYEIWHSIFASSSRNVHLEILIVQDSILEIIPQVTLKIPEWGHMGHRSRIPDE
jgi:hypothetical protein